MQIFEINEKIYQMSCRSFSFSGQRLLRVLKAEQGQALRVFKIISTPTLRFG